MKEDYRGFNLYVAATLP